jgi:hypothetical protein
MHFMPLRDHRHHHTLQLPTHSNNITAGTQTGILEQQYQGPQLWSKMFTIMHQNHKNGPPKRKP